MSKNFLKLNSWILTIIGIVAIMLLTICLFFAILKPSESSWGDLGKIIIIARAIITYILSFPLLISGIGTLHYFKRKDNYKLCITSDIIGAILYGIFIFVGFVVTN